MPKKIIFVVLTLILLVACSSDAGETVPVSSEAPVDAVDTAYPYPFVDLEKTAAAMPTEEKTPYPDAEMQNLAPPTEVKASEITATVPAPDSDTGVVAGRLYSTKADAPLSKTGVYLGDYIYLTPGPEYMVSLRQGSSPHTITDAAGNFVIEDVLPGEYPIIAWTPVNSYVIPAETEETELVVLVVAGQVTDLGEIRIDWP